MFGLNEIVGPSYFKDVANDQLMVTSRFLTIQGEGPLASRVAYFIRLTKCSLACSWCDAFFDQGDYMSFDEIEADIEAQIDKFYEGNVPEFAKHSSYEETEVEYPNGPNYPVNRTVTRYKRKDIALIVTGGEPSLQKNLSPFLERMSKIFRWTQIESNGTHFLKDIPDSTILVVSPKCAEKDGKPTKYLTPRPEVLERANVLKFVVHDDPESPYHDIPEWAYTWKEQTGRDIYISPMNIYNDLPEKAKAVRDGRNQIDIEDRSTADEVISFWEKGLLDMEANQRNHEYAGHLVIKNGFVLNLQQHLYVSVA